MRSLTKEINTNADGTIELFSVVHNYVADTVTVIEGYQTTQLSI